MKIEPDNLSLMDRLPWLFHWLEWCLLSYWGSLPICVALVVAYKAWQESFFLYRPALIDWPTFQLSLFAGFCLWVVVCVIRQGHGLG